MIRLLLLFFNLTIVIGISAQSLSLSWHQGAIADGSSIQYSGDINDAMIVEVFVTNVTGSAINYSVKKIEVSIIPGTMNTICFAGQCIDPQSYYSDDTLTLPGGEADSSFSADYYPLGMTGTSSIKYVFFNTDNPSDSVSFSIDFTAMTGIKSANLRNKVTFSNAYPNPAIDRVYFDYYIPANSKNVVFILRDLAGQSIREFALDNDKQVLELDLIAIESGVYFYSVIAEGASLLTKKLIIKK